MKKQLVAVLRGGPLDGERVLVVGRKGYTAATRDDFTAFAHYEWWTHNSGKIIGLFTGWVNARGEVLHGRSAHSPDCGS